MRSWAFDLARRCKRIHGDRHRFNRWRSGAQHLPRQTGVITFSLERYGFGADSTLGKLYQLTDEGRELQCFTLEDEIREIKIPGETAIPAGTYEIKLRTEGGMHEKYLRKFLELPHRGMLWLQNIPDFEWVYLHIGNTDDDSLGCPLVGRVPNTTASGEFQVYESTAAYRELYPKLADPIADGERVVLEVTHK
mgnify:CR=1 FL=1